MIRTFLFEMMSELLFLTKRIFLKVRKRSYRVSLKTNTRSRSFERDNLRKLLLITTWDAYYNKNFLHEEPLRILKLSRDITFFSNSGKIQFLIDFKAHFVLFFP